MYEAHMTFDLSEAEACKEFASDPNQRWRYSQILGDPVLGPGGRCYLTAYGKDPLDLKYQMIAISEMFRMPIRMKIEHIVYDTKTGVDRADEFGTMERLFEATCEWVDNDCDRTSSHAVMDAALSLKEQRNPGTSHEDK